MRSRRGMGIAAVAVAVVLLVAVIALVIPGGSTVPLTPAVTRAQAARILASYTQANNQANDQLSSPLLSTVEDGTSYAIDAGVYRRDQAIDGDRSGKPIPSFKPAAPRYYVPRLAADQYPRWFVVQTGQWYVLFSQSAKDASWLDAMEPSLLRASGPTPRVAVDSAGYAETVTSAGLEVAPGMIQRATARALDGNGSAPVPANLADSEDKKFWDAQHDVSVYDQHQAGPGTVYGLRTADGGALLFYNVSAKLTISPATGLTFRLTIPGWYSGTAVSLGVLNYAEQFAVYDPPAAHRNVTFVGDYSGVVSRGLWRRAVRLRSLRWFRGRRGRGGTAAAPPGPARRSSARRC